MEKENFVTKLIDSGLDVEGFSGLDEYVAGLVGTLEVEELQRLLGVIKYKPYLILIEKELDIKKAPAGTGAHSSCT